MKQKIINYIRAGYPGLYLLSSEEQRVEAEIKAIAMELEQHLHFWSVVDGLIDTEGKVINANDPMEVLEKIDALPEPSIILLRDYHMFLADANPVLVRKLKDVLLTAKTKSKTIIVLGCRLCLPPELEHELTVLEFALPSKDQLGTVLDGIVESAELQPITGEQRDKALDAACGLTTMEAENAYALSVVKTKAIDPNIIASEKAQAVKKNGLLEIVDTGAMGETIETSETSASLNSIGGLDVLKDWLLKRRHSYSNRAKEYGLPTLKGLLITGIPGTGKSLTAKATAKVFGVPLLKLDAGRIFAGLVGQSEANLRSVIQTAEAIAPCCLWIDEMEKAFSGTKSSGSTDGGTSSRVFGSFISWMQEKTKPVFIVATANDVSQLPPEMLRKGRFDELFFVDLPNQAERAAIWDIQISKYGRDPGEFDLAQLARMTEGLTGSEIEAVFVEALFEGFDQGKEPTDLTIARVMNGFVPLSKLMAEPIENLRKWAKGRAKYATTQEQGGKLRKMAA